MTSSSLPYRLFVGIDIAAKTCAVSWMSVSSTPSRAITIEQTPRGAALLLERLSSLESDGEAILVVMEATGTYWMRLATFLVDADLPISVINPVQAHDFAKALLKRSKTDAIDAQTIAQTERDRADVAAAVSFSRELAVQAKLNLTVDPERSILLGLAALNQAYSQEAENVLHEAVLASRLRLILRGHEGPVEDLTYSPDGKMIATASDDKTARLWDTATGQQVLTLSHPAVVGHVVRLGGM